MRFLKALFSAFVVVLLCAPISFAFADTAAVWQGYAYHNDSWKNAGTNAPTPTDTTSLKWNFDWGAWAKEKLGSTYPNASEPVLVTSSGKTYAYIAVDTALLKIDTETGALVDQVNLSHTIGYTTRPIYADGKLVIPLDTGGLNIVNLEPFGQDTKVIAKVSNNAQNNSTIVVQDGKIYYGTVDVTYDPITYASSFSNGYFSCVDLATGTVLWQHNNAAEGYYWAGPAVTDAYVVVATSAGTVEVLDKATGAFVSSATFSAIINSDCVLSPDKSKIYLMSRDGKLRILAIESLGAIREVDIVDLGLDGCASTPTIINDKLYVGGTAGTSSALAIFDTNTKSTQLVSATDSGPLPVGSGGIKGAPLVSVQSSGTYVYFTVNYGETADWVAYTSGGGVYRYKLGETNASLIYDAAGHQNYCDSPVISDEDGNLYYINDSGNLFCLLGGNTTEPVTPANPTTPENPSTNNDGTNTNAGGVSGGDDSGKANSANADENVQSLADVSDEDAASEDASVLAQTGDSFVRVCAMVTLALFALCVCVVAYARKHKA